MEKNKIEEKEVNYDIEFIDPDELIDFISEDSKNTPQTAQIVEEDIENTPELKYTDLIRESSGDYVQKRREDTRGRLALIYTVFTFLMFFVAIIVAVLDGLARQVSIIQNLTTLLPLVSGIFLGTLGFVLGYYFKREDRP